MTMARARVVSAVATTRLHDKEVRRQARDLVAQARRRIRVEEVEDALEEV
jgi:hypothetical protein